MCIFICLHVTDCHPFISAWRITFSLLDRWSAPCTLSLGEGGLRKFFLQCLLHPSFPPVARRNLHQGRLGFCTFSVFCGYPPGTTLSRFFLTGERGWGRLTAPLVPQPISRCLPIAKCTGERRPLGPMACGAGSQSNHQGTLACEWMSHSLFEKQDEEHLLPPCCWCHSCVPLVLNIISLSLVFCPVQ